MWMLILYLGGNTGHSGRGERIQNRKGKKASKGCFTNYITFVGKWSIVPIA